MGRSDAPVRRHAARARADRRGRAERRLEPPPRGGAWAARAPPQAIARLCVAARVGRPPRRPARAGAPCAAGGDAR